MIRFCEVCAEPASLGTLGNLTMHWQCPKCFAQSIPPQVAWGTPEPEPVDDTLPAVAAGTGASVTLGAKTARLVAAALDEWVVIMSTQLVCLSAEEDLGWDESDIAMVAGAAKIIRDAELTLPDTGASML